MSNGSVHGREVDFILEYHHVAQTWESHSIGHLYCVYWLSFDNSNRGFQSHGAMVPKAETQLLAVDLLKLQEIVGRSARETRR